MEEHVHSDNQTKNTTNARLKDVKLNECLAVSFHLMAYNLTVCLFPAAAERAVYSSV